MTNEREQKTILVLGGTGKTGRRIVERLRRRGVPARVGSRSAQQPFDWTDQATWAPLLRDIDTVYVSYYPDLAVPGAPETVGAFTELAVASGVSRLVLLSGRGEEEAQVTEGLVQSSGVEWTILRSSWFSQNFSEDYLLEPVRGGEVVLPVGTVPEPFVDADDIAEVAVAALTGNGHAGQLYELTGPRLLTFGEAIAEISTATGRSIDFVQVSPGQYADALTAEGVPVGVVELLTYLFTTVLDGRNGHLADGVQRALGRAPRDFADYAADTAATGVWDQE
ncbi:NmrA family transcriptional regulator [Micromonospora craterilacus]|uniref:NmrA family transcriptional regulator n=1 Tax=Micromonospora craterilacus TaxID=1655439 RepID=A0A2W2FF87_9ACTN|nr:NAD(P)H-binding protein [Micromonospora craterilacus]PZG24130.1 NmrA family transcriptional regulator [Micromonospora craterilacus]